MPTPVRKDRSSRKTDVVYLSRDLRAIAKNCVDRVSRRDLIFFFSFLKGSTLPFWGEGEEERGGNGSCGRE